MVFDRLRTSTLARRVIVVNRKRVGVGRPPGLLSPSCDRSSFPAPTPTGIREGREKKGKSRARGSSATVLCEIRRAPPRPRV